MLMLATEKHAKGEDHAVYSNDGFWFKDEAR